MSPVDAGKGGELRKADVGSMPSLAGNGVSQVLYRLYPCGMNSVQMHPRASELFYVINATELVVGFVEENGGRTVENTLKTGQLSFVPKGLMHWHYNAGCEDAVFLSTFNHEDPGVVTIVNALFDINATSLQAALNVDRALVADLKTSVPPSPVPGIAECLRRCGLEAVDPCELKRCGNHERCRVNDEGKAVCECRDQYARDENGDCRHVGGWGEG